MRIELLLDMFKRQDVLNKAYNGENWSDNIQAGFLLNALMTEYVEFLAERTEDWLWYSRKTKMDNEASLFEAIDMLHFMMAYVLYRMDLDVVERHLSNMKFYTVTGNHLDFYNDRYECLNSVIADFCLFEGSHLIRILNLFIDILSFITEYTEDEIYQAYLLKNERNFQRAYHINNNPEFDFKSEETKLCLMK